MGTETEFTEKKRWTIASYVRLSREDQVQGESDSITGQKKLIEDWAARSGSRVVACYSDDGFSGSTFERPGFEQMMDDAERGRFDTIVVKDLSRFGRSYLDCGRLIERDLPRIGVRLYSIADDFDSMQRWDYNTALLLPMKNLMNEMQVVSTSEKVRTSLNAKRRRGECVANFAPYGYLKDRDDKHRLIVDEEAARVVRRIFQMRLQGESASAIARALNREHVESPAARKARVGTSYKTCFGSGGAPSWHANTVMRILRDETYTGALVQGKTRRPSWRMHRGFPVAREEWVRCSGTHEAIISPEAFGQVEALFGRGAAQEGDKEDAGEGLRAVSGSASMHASNDPLLGHIYCGICGSSLRRVDKRSDTATYSYYVCAAHKRNPRKCGSRYIRTYEVQNQLHELMFAPQAGRQPDRQFGEGIDFSALEPTPILDGMVLLI